MTKTTNARVVRVRRARAPKGGFSNAVSPPAVKGVKS